MRHGWRIGFAILALLLALPSGARSEAAKFPTDDVVRTEMKAIRDLTLNAHTLVTHRRMPPADARTFHARVAAAAGRINAGTTLQGEAREKIEKLAGDIAKGAAAVAGAEAAITPIDGIVSIDEALSIYAQRFDHPGWQPLR